MVLQIREKKLSISIQPFEESQIPSKDECIQKALDSLVFVREVLEQALKTQESSKPSLNSRTIQSATFDNPEVEKSFQRLKAIIKKEKIDVMKLFAD